MNVRYDDGAAVVTLSERNLRDLTAQFAERGDADLSRMTDNGWLIVLVESDEQHYQGRTPGRGSGTV